MKIFKLGIRYIILKVMATGAFPSLVVFRFTINYPIRAWKEIESYLNYNGRYLCEGLYFIARVRIKYRI